MLRPRMCTKCQKQRENPCALLHGLLPYCLTALSVQHKLALGTHSERKLAGDLTAHADCRVARQMCWPQTSRAKSTQTLGVCIKNTEELLISAKPSVGTRSKDRLPDYLSANAVARLSFKPDRPHHGAPNMR